MGSLNKHADRPVSNYAEIIPGGPHPSNIQTAGGGRGAARLPPVVAQAIAHRGLNFPRDVAGEIPGKVKATLRGYGASAWPVGPSAHPLPMRMQTLTVVLPWVCACCLGGAAGEGPGRWRAPGELCRIFIVSLRLRRFSPKPGNWARAGSITQPRAPIAVKPRKFAIGGSYASRLSAAPPVAPPI